MFPTATGVQGALRIQFFIIKVVKPQGLLPLPCPNRDSRLAAVPACGCKSPASSLPAQRVADTLYRGVGACWR